VHTLLFLLLLFCYNHLGNDQFLAFGNLTWVYVTSLTGNILRNKPLSCPVCYMPRRHRGEVEGQLYLYLISAQGGIGGWVVKCHALATLPMWKRPGTHCTGGYVDLVGCQSRWVWKIMSSPKFKLQTVQ